MSKRTVWAFFLVLVALFLVTNRAAYKGYFADDEIDNLSWAPKMDLQDFGTELVTPKFIPDNFRPVGHFYFYALGKLFGLDFPKYVAVIHLLHLLNVVLLWMLLRKLGAARESAAIGVLFFAVHMALFDALWKPMYVFDVLCASFCLMSLIAYVERRWLLSFLAFWLAYKSKEVAVMLPAVMAAYEWSLGERRWKPLLPFFLISLSFGLQGILLNPNKDNEYTFRFTLPALWKTVSFYSGRLLLIPYAGLALLAVPFLTRHRRAWFGLAMTAVLIFPMLFLPGRLYSAYCYMPLLGIAVALSAVELTAFAWRAAAALFLLLWLPWDYRSMRIQRRTRLAQADEARAYVTAIGQFAAKSDRIDAFVYSGAPVGFQHWGTEGAIRYFYERSDINVRYISDPDAPKVFQTPRFAMMSWDGGIRHLSFAVHTPETPDAAYLKMNETTPIWQLEQGWYPLEDTFRWTQPVATARLLRPAGALRFTMRVNIGAEQRKLAGVQQVTVSLNGVPIGPPRSFPDLAWQEAVWDLEPAAAGEVEVRVEVTPGFHPMNETRELGLAIGGFGFAQ
jgi:hypothetical protein